MSETVRTSEGTVLGGWMLRGSRSTFDVAPMLERYGQIYRHPVSPGERAELMAPGQPCFLHLGDTSRVVGLWAIGEVVAPVLELDGVLHAEVEMLPLTKPISDDKLRREAALARSELFSRPAPANPLVLTPEAVRAIESFDFELVPATEDQARALDRLLADEEAALGD